MIVSARTQKAEFCASVPFTRVQLISAVAQKEFSLAFSRKHRRLNVQTVFPLEHYALLTKFQGTLP